MRRPEKKYISGMLPATSNREETGEQRSTYAAARANGVGAVISDRTGGVSRSVSPTTSARWSTAGKFLVNPLRSATADTVPTIPTAHAVTPTTATAANRRSHAARLADGGKGRRSPAGHSTH